jgi:uncharacterized protein (DUF1501 family)
MNHRTILHQFDATSRDHMKLAALQKCCKSAESPTTLAEVRAAIQAGEVDCEAMAKALTTASEAATAAKKAAKKAEPAKTKTKSGKGEKENEPSKPSGG